MKSMNYFDDYLGRFERMSVVAYVRQVLNGVAFRVT